MADETKTADETSNKLTEQGKVELRGEHRDGKA